MARVRLKDKPPTKRKTDRTASKPRTERWVKEAADRAEGRQSANGHGNGTYRGWTAPNGQHVEDTTPRPYVRKETSARPGRPPKLTYDERTINTIVGLGSIKATLNEIRAVLRVTEVTFYEFLKKYPDVKQAYDDAYEEGSVSLRRKQWALADTSATMAMWLGKQYLDQRDRYDPPPQQAIPTMTIDAAQLAKLTPEQREALQESLRILMPERFKDLDIPKDVTPGVVDLQKGVEYHPDE